MFDQALAHVPQLTVYVIEYSVNDSTVAYNIPCLHISSLVCKTIITWFYHVVNPLGKLAVLNQGQHTSRHFPQTAGSLDSHILDGDLGHNTSDIAAQL